MPRSPLPRTLFALLPIAGALLAAWAGHQAWSMPFSLLAMATVASASAVIYWSAPLQKKSAFAESPAPAVQEVTQLAVPVAEAPPAPFSPVMAIPEPGSAGTRAETLITGKKHETDLLTGLLDSEAFFAKLAGELARCKAANQTAILVICDIDAFRIINQTIGLMDANRMLRQVADCFRLTVREGDILSRLGGDEFGIFFPGLPPEIAETRGRDLRAAVREAGLLTLPEGSPQVTACLGMSCFPSDGDTVDTLLAAADLSLAECKRERLDRTGAPIPSALVIART